MANDVWSQKMAFRNNALGGVLGALAQLAQRQNEERKLEEMRRQDVSFQEQFPIIQDKSFTVGDKPRPQQMVSTDLLGKPITERVTQTANMPNYGLPAGQQYSVPSPVPLEQLRGSVSVPPQINTTNLLQQLMSGNPQNPITQARLSQFGKIPAIAQGFAPQTTQTDPTKDTQTRDMFGNIISETKGQPKETGSDEPKLPVGFAQITNPATKAKVWNDVFGGNMTAEDFKEIQDRPYFQPVTDRDGKIHVFDSRTGDFVKTPSDITKPAPTEVRQQVVAYNNNLKSLEEVKKILSTGKTEDMTGVLTGRLKKVGTKFFNDKDAQTLKNRLAQLRTIVYGLSGKQINESELAWLKEEVLPEMKQPTENFEVTLQEFENWVNRSKGSVLSQFPNIKDDYQSKQSPQNNLKSKYGLE